MNDSTCVPSGFPYLSLGGGPVVSDHFLFMGSRESANILRLLTRHVEGSTGGTSRKSYSLVVSN